VLFRFNSIIVCCQRKYFVDAFALKGAKFENFSLGESFLSTTQCSKTISHLAECLQGALPDNALLHLMRKPRLEKASSS